MKRSVSPDTPFQSDGPSLTLAASRCLLLSQLTLYLSALLSLLTATLLGFLDDVFDIRWRHKLPIPLVASIPLLLVYYAQGGLTAVVMPKGFRNIFGDIVDLGQS
jgi:UDP-N-acetylglucosamine--dolichyl-phosphate N-acetylglucosaminephosphotransferase